MTRLLTLFATSFTVLLFIFLSAQPSTAQPLIQASLQVDQPISTPRPTAAQPPPKESNQESQPQNLTQEGEPDVDWAKVEMADGGETYFPQASTPIPIIPPEPQDVAPVPSESQDVDPVHSESQGEAPVPSEPAEEASSPPNDESPTPTTSEITHLVSAGETLYEIARRYGIPLEQLITANSVQNPRRLQIGQVLIIPGPGSNQQVAEVTPQVEATQDVTPQESQSQDGATQDGATQDGATQPSSDTYIVKRGDVLSRISRSYGVSVEALMTVNQIGDPRRLKVGQVLIIPQNDEANVAAPTPVDVTPVTAVTPVPALAAAEPFVTGDTDVYVVKRGDILSRIASSFGVTIQALVAANRLDSPDRIYTGQTLTIPSNTVEEPTETPAPLATETPAPSPTETPTPSPTEVQSTPAATQANVEVSYSPPPGDYLFIRPVPLQDGWIPRGYSYWHPGIDIILPIGTPIRAASGGIVEFSGWNANGFGNLVVLDHGNGYRTLYAHQSERKVADGDTVAQGDVIGLVGITGWATHPHLHFEIRQGFRPVFPCDYLPGGCQ